MIWAGGVKFAQQIHIRQIKSKSNQNRIMMIDVIDEQANHICQIHTKVPKLLDQTCIQIQ